MFVLINLMLFVLFIYKLTIVLFFYFKVLYLKNLAKKVSENDLYSIYSSFYSSESNEVKCKLMNGKMKCQAFITFSGIYQF